jgi:hypothetical protein
MKTDAQLQHDVIAELMSDARVHAHQICVEAKDGVVVVSGEVGSPAARWNVQSAALRVSGVTELAVELDVELAPLDEPCNADTAESAQRAFDWAASVPVDSVEVLRADGWAPLADAMGGKPPQQAVEVESRPPPDMPVDFRLLRSRRDLRRNPFGVLSDAEGRAFPPSTDSLLI